MTCRSHKKIFLMFCLGVALIKFQLAASESESTQDPLATPARSALWVPLMSPISFLAPGVGHYFKGDFETGHRLLKIHGVNFSSIVAEAAIMVSLGAADVASMALIPFIMISGTTWFTLFIADLIGMVSEPTLEEFNSPNSWDARYLAKTHCRFQNKTMLGNNFFCGLSGRWKDEFLRIKSEISAPLSGDYYFATVQLDSPFATFLDIPKALEVSIDLSHEQNFTGRFDQTTIGLALQTVTPLSIIGESLKNVTAFHRIGYRHLFVNYEQPSHLKLEDNGGVIASFLVNWRIDEFWTTQFGYSHDRHDLIGDISSGFMGVFNGGFEYQLTPTLWLGGRLYQGKRKSIEISLDTREI